MDKNKYFYRNVIFSKQGKLISIIDIENPKENKEELDPWFGMVIQLADGQHTLKQLYEFMATQYKANLPENFNQTLDSVIQRLVESKLIVLTNDITKLPYYMSMPFEMLNEEKAKSLLEKDRLEKIIK